VAQTNEYELRLVCLNIGNISLSINEERKGKQIEK
jgi:hypothetical protein